MQVTPVFKALTEDESSELQKVWQTSRKGMQNESISDLVTFEGIVMDQMSNDGKVMQETSKQGRRVLLCSQSCLSNFQVYIAGRAFYHHIVRRRS